MTLLCLPGQPDPGQWDIHERWWITQKEVLDSKLSNRGDQPDWAMYCTWRSKLFMSFFMETQKLLVLNITATSLEKLIWNFTAMRNILIDLAIVTEADLERPVTYFQKLAVMGR